MYRGSPSASFSLPGEYRKAAERLFPKGGISRNQKLDLKLTAEFAKVLGISTDYQRLLALDKSSVEFRAFLEHFQNNLDLLIRKTWVEKYDENRKGKLQDEIPSFMTMIEQGDFSKTIEKFSTILDELAYLFFGNQSESEDFAEYTFRIDAQMGLFWWYAGRLILYKDFGNEKVLWAVLLIGLCYLTNF